MCVQTAFTCFHRMGKSLCLYKVDADLTLVNKLKKGGIRHACMNPYYPEVVYVRNDSIMKWDTQNKPVCVLNGWQPRFSVESDVRSVSCLPQDCVKYAALELLLQYSES